MHIFNHWKSGKQIFLKKRSLTNINTENKVSVLQKIDQKLESLGARNTEIPQRLIETANTFKDLELSRSCESEGSVSSASVLETTQEDVSDLAKDALG